MNRTLPVIEVGQYLVGSPFRSIRLELADYAATVTVSATTSRVYADGSPLTVIRRIAWTDLRGDKCAGEANRMMVDQLEDGAKRAWMDRGASVEEARVG